LPHGPQHLGSDARVRPLVDVGRGEAADLQPELGQARLPPAVTREGDELHAQPALHERLAARFELRCDGTGPPYAAQRGRALERHLELSPRGGAGAQDRVAEGDGLDEGVAARHVNEGAGGGHDEQPIDLAELVVAEPRAVHQQPRAGLEVLAASSSDVEQLLTGGAVASQHVDAEHPQRRAVAERHTRRQHAPQGLRPQGGQSTAPRGA
jgi:hypothetical protein